MIARGNGINFGVITYKFINYIWFNMHHPYTQHGNIWNSLSAEKQVIYLVCYSSIFLDGIPVRAITEICGSEPEEVESAITKLINERKITKNGEIISCVNLNISNNKFDNDEKIITRIIRENGFWIHLMKKLPIIRFIGISGSLAAHNPVRQKDRNVDMDLFIITSRYSLWILAFFVKLYTGLKINKLFKHPLCINYIMDGTFLKIHNPNFYVASEIVNLKPLYGKKMYNQFIEANKWVYNYYPNFSPKANFN